LKRRLCIFSFRFPLFDFALKGHGVAEGIEAAGVGGGRRGAVFLLDLQVDFFAVDRHIARGGDPEPDLVAADFDDSDFNIVADFDALVKFSSEY